MTRLFDRCFAETKGSTELMEDLDPDEARAIVDPRERLVHQTARTIHVTFAATTCDKSSMDDNATVPTIL